MPSHILQALGILCNKDFTAYASSSGKTATFTLSLWHVQSDITVRQGDAQNTEHHVNLMVFNNLPHEDII
jgi:hypothetical protein